MDIDKFLDFTGRTDRSWRSGDLSLEAMISFSEDGFSCCVREMVPGEARDAIWFSVIDGAVCEGILNGLPATSFDALSSAFVQQVSMIGNTGDGDE